MLSSDTSAMVRSLDIVLFGSVTLGVSQGMRLRNSTGRAFVFYKGAGVGISDIRIC